MNKHVSVSVAAGALLLGMGVLPVFAADYPSQKQADIAHTAKYVGGDACKECHGDLHAKWKTSWHTIKATQGPAMGKQYEKNIYEWVRRDWDKLDTYMILDQKDKTTNYVMSRKIKPEEVGYVIDRYGSSAMWHTTMARQPKPGCKPPRTAASPGHRQKPDGEVCRQ